MNVPTTKFIIATNWKQPQMSTNRRINCVMLMQWNTIQQWKRTNYCYHNNIDKTQQWVKETYILCNSNYIKPKK